MPILKQFQQHIKYIESLGFKYVGWSKLITSDTKVFKFNINIVSGMNMQNLIHYVYNDMKSSILLDYNVLLVIKGKT